MWTWVMISAWIGSMSKPICNWLARAIIAGLVALEEPQSVSSEWYHQQYARERVRLLAAEQGFRLLPA
jgi:hypothetical protein